MKEEKTKVKKRPPAEEEKIIDEEVEMPAFLRNRDF